MKVRLGFGLGTTASVGMNGEAFWRVIDACESLGWDSIWFSERATGDLPDPLAAMAAVAGRTRRLKFGTSVLVLPGRNPVLLAKELATIDVLSNGRLVPAFGLGAPLPDEHEVFFVDRAERASRADEAVVLMKRLWAEEQVTFQGRFYSVRDVALRPRPVQRPHPDVWFGGHSRAALRRVGRLGDGWLPSFVAPAEYRGMADEIRGAAAAAEREIDEEHFGVLVPYVDDGERTEAVLAAVAARRPGIDPRQVVSVGGTEVLRRRLEAFLEQGASKFVVVPVLPPREWEEELARLRDEVAAPLEGISAARD